MGNYYALELFSGDKRQIFFSEKGLPPSEFLTVFRPCDRAYPSFPSGFEDSDDRYIPSHAYVVSVAKLTERLEVMGFTLQCLEENVKRCLKANQAELDRRIESRQKAIANDQNLERRPPLAAVFPMSLTVPRLPLGGRQFEEVDEPGEEPGA